MYRFQQKLKNFKNKLKHWNKTSFGNTFQAQIILDNKMNKIQYDIISQGRTSILKERECSVTQLLVEQSMQEEIF